MEDGLDSTSPTYVKDLRAFCLVVDLGSITSAAKQLRESKSLISRRLSRLERELGVQLLQRNPRMVRPTESGAAYHRRMRQALRALGDASKELQGDGTPHGPFRIHTSHGFGISVLTPLIFDFTERYPKIEVDVVLSDEQPAFTTNRVDIAILPAQQLRDASLIVRRLLDWEIVLVASPAYLDRYGVPDSPESLASYKIVFGSRPPRDPGRTLSISPGPGMRTRRINMESAVVTMNTVFAREAALADKAIGYVPDFMVERDIAEGRLVQVMPESRFHTDKGGMFLFYPAMAFIPPKLRVFSDFISETLSIRRRRSTRGAQPAARKSARK
jgi:DNA-binding transcriptional LysR family regulator